MEINSNHRENPLKKFTPQSNVDIKKAIKQVESKKKAWWELNDSNKEKDETKKMSLAEKVMFEENMQKDANIDKAIEGYSIDLSLNGQIMVKYMEKYLKKDMPLFNKIKELEKTDIRNEFCEYEWALIIEQAWILSYRKAMDDEYITLEERHELNNLYSLGKKYKNSLFYQPQMKKKIQESFKVLGAIDNKYSMENKYNDGELWMKKYDTVPKQTKHYRRLPTPHPKLTPYSDGQFGYR